MDDKTLKEIESEILSWPSHAGFRGRPLYKLLSRILTRFGYWHRLPRGNPKLGFKNMKARKGE